MQNIRTLVIALRYGEIHTIAHCMNHFLGEFLEGCIESEQETARLRFNFVWKNLLSDKEKQAVLDACPFESVANDLAKKNGLIEPYEKVGEGAYGVAKWKRVREDSTDLKAFKDIPEFIYGLWKKARNE